MPTQAQLDAQNNAARSRQQARRGIEQSAPQRPQPQVQQPYVNPYGGQYGTDSIQDQGYYDNYYDDSYVNPYGAQYGTDSIQDQGYYDNYYDEEEMTEEEWAAYLAGLRASQESQDTPSYYSDYGSRMPDGPIESSYSGGPQATTGNVGPQITDASQLREFMSGLNEQAQEAETPYLQYIQDNAQQSQGGGANQMEQGSAGSPQSNYYDFVQRGGQMNDEQLRQANEMASSMGTTFDPETGYSRQPYQDRQEQGPQVQSPMSVRDTQDMLYERFGSPTVSGNMNPSMSGLETDAQGRMIPGGYEDRIEAYLPYEQEQYQREVNQANRQDFSTPYRSGADTRDERNEMPDFRTIARQSGATGSKVNAQSKILEAAWRNDRQQEKVVDAQLRSGRNKQTANEEKADLIRQANPDLPEEEIAAITSGLVRVVQNPSTGETTLLNLATGTSKKVNTGQETGLNFDIAAPESTLFSRAGEYTGAVEAAKRKGQGITGQFGVDIATDASIGAAQDFETAQNELVRAFRDSARYSATEANQLKKELNIALSPFEDPKTAEAKLRSIDKSLSRRYKNEEAVALDENESIAKREDARSRARAILQFRTTLGVPEEGAKPVEVKFDPKSLTGENQQAYAWATSNPSDPRSRAILAKLNSQ